MNKFWSKRPVRINVEFRINFNPFKCQQKLVFPEGKEEGK
jgi:hypothetical protein